MHSPKRPPSPLTSLLRRFCHYMSPHGVSVASRKRQRRHYDQDQGNVGGKRNVSRREAGRATLEALKPSPTEVLLTINRDNLGGESLGLLWFGVACMLDGPPLCCCCFSFSIMSSLVGNTHNFSVLCTPLSVGGIWSYLAVRCDAETLCGLIIVEFENMTRLGGVVCVAVSEGKACSLLWCVAVFFVFVVLIVFARMRAGFQPRSVAGANTPPLWSHWRRYSALDSLQQPLSFLMLSLPHTGIVLSF